MCDKTSKQNNIETNSLNPQGLIVITEETKSNLMLLVDEEGMSTKEAAKLLSINPTAAGTIISGEIKRLNEASEKIQKQMEMVEKIVIVKGQCVEKNAKVRIPKIVKKSGMERLIGEDEIHRILVPGGDSSIQKAEGEKIRIRMKKIAGEKMRLGMDKVTEVKGEKKRKVEESKMITQLGKEKYDIQRAKDMEEKQRVAEEKARLKMQKEAEVIAGRKRKAEEKARLKIQRNSESTKESDILTVKDTKDTNNTKVYRSYAKVNDKLRRYLIFLVKDQEQSIQEAANFLMIRYEEAVAIIHHEEDRVRRATDLETIETREDDVIIEQSNERIRSIRAQQADKKKMEIKQKLLSLVHEQEKPIKEAAKLLGISHLEARGIVDEEINRLKAITQKKIVKK